MTTATKTLALPEQFKDAMALVAKVLGIKTIANKAEYDLADADYKSIIQKEKLLEIQYKALDCVILAKAAQVYKNKLAADLDAAKKYIKNSPMRAFDDKQEADRLAEELRLQKIAQDIADAEAKVLAKEQARLKVIADKEAARLFELAKKSKDADEKARILADAAAATLRAVAAAEEQARIKSQPAVAVVVVESSHKGVTRRQVMNWRLTTADKRQIEKKDWGDSDRYTMQDFPTMPKHLFVLSKVLVNGFVDDQGLNAAIPGVLEVKSKMV